MIFIDLGTSTVIVILREEKMCFVTYVYLSTWGQKTKKLFTLLHNFSYTFTKKKWLLQYHNEHTTIFICLSYARLFSRAKIIFLIVLTGFFLIIFSRWQLKKKIHQILAERVLYSYLEWGLNTSVLLNFSSIHIWSYNCTYTL